MANELVASLFYTFRQNNSGGKFDIDKDVARYVIIEAFGHEDANRRALEIGIYFDGCETGMDCPCCGDRWYEAWEGEGTKRPTVNGGNPDDVVDMFCNEGERPVRIHYLSGLIAMTGEASVDTIVRLPAPEDN